MPASKHRSRARPAEGTRRRATARRGPGRPAGADTSAATRARIVDAAVACFAEHGYAKASNREIARRAGVTGALLYHYFDSKAELFWSALFEVDARLVTIYREASAAAPDAPSMRQLSLGLERVIELTRARPELMRFAGNAEGEIARHPELRAHRNADDDSFAGLFRDLVQRARARGELDRAVDVEAAVKVLQACFAALALLHATCRDSEDFAAILRTFEHLIVGDFMLPEPRRGTRFGQR